MKSALVTGSGQVVQFAVGLLRAKGAALLLGPTGVGLNSNLMAAQGFVSAAVSFGLPFSASRYVAIQRDGEDASKAAAVVAIVCALTGALGASITFLAAEALSQWVFGSPDQASALRIVSIVLLLSGASSGMQAAIQGRLRIADLARARASSAAVGAFLAVGAYWIAGIDGVPFALVLVALAEFFAYYAPYRRLRPRKPLQVRIAFLGAMRLMLPLGLGFMAAMLARSACDLQIRSAVGRLAGLEGVGLYSAAFGLIALITGFSFGAVSTHLMPRLTMEHRAGGQVAQSVNEHVQLVSLIAGIMSLAAVVLARTGIALVYSVEFIPAAGVIVAAAPGFFLATALQPVGLALVAGGAGRAFAFLNLSFEALRYLMTIFGLSEWGLEGAGIGYTAAYLIWAPLQTFVVRRALGVTLTRKSLFSVATLFLVVVGALVMDLFLANSFALRLCAFGVGSIIAARVAFLWRGSPGLKDVD